MVQGYTAAKKNCPGFDSGACSSFSSLPFFVSKKKENNQLSPQWFTGKHSLKGIWITYLFSSMLKSFPPRTRYNCEEDPLSPPEGEATQGGKSLLDPQFRPFFRCVFTAMLHGARVDRPRAPLAPSLSNTVHYRFSHENELNKMQGME